MRLHVLAAALLVLSVPVAAEQAEVYEVDVKPGVVQAASPIYFLDGAVERFSTMTGLRTEGSVVHEKASEIAVAQERNQTEAAERAEKRLNETVAEASNESYEGLRKAEQVLKMVQDSTSEDADQGLSTALEAIQKAQNRKPEQNHVFDGLPDMGERNRSDRDVGLPDIGEEDRRGG